MIRKIRTKIQAGEWYAVFISFIYYFFVLAAYYVIRPIRDQMAVEAGSSELPVFFGVTFLTTLALTPLFGWLVSRWPRRVVMPFVYLFCITCQVIFILLFEHGNLLSPPVLGLLFYVWVSIFNLFIVSVFWSFMTDIWNEAQARRLFPIIGLGGTAGAIMGPIITRSLVEMLGSSRLMGVSVIFLAVAVVCIGLLGNWAHTHGANRGELNNDSAVGGSMWDGLKQNFSTPFIASMSIMMLFNDAIGTIAYALITDYSGIAFPHDVIAQTRFAANMDLAANVIQIVIQLTLTRWILVYYGAKTVFTIWTSLIVSACLIIVFVNNPYNPILGAIPWIAMVNILARSLSFGMIQPARESLYTVVSRNLRYKGKNAVDTVVWRAGDVASMVAINGFQTMGVTVAGFGMIWALLAASSGVIGWLLADSLEEKIGVE
jgi:AAA family ATP:ADP antiporter